MAGSSSVPTGRRAVLQGGAALAAGWTGVRRARAQPASIEKLRLIVRNSPVDPIGHPLYYARDAGFFAANGLEIDYTTIVSATNATRAVVSGAADIGWVDSVSSLQARQAGARIKCMSGFSSKLDYQIVGAKALTDMKQLEGRRFGVATIGGATYAIPRLLVRNAGGDPDKVAWVAVGNSAARVQALVSGAVDATLITTSLMAVVGRYDKYHLILDTGPALPTFAYALEIAGESVIAKRKPALQAFVKSVAQGVGWAGQNRDKAIAFSQALLPDQPKEEVAAAINSYLDRHYWQATGAVSPALINGTVSILVSSGELTRSIPYDEFVDASIAGTG